jgi:hypothetical protein
MAVQLLEETAVMEDKAETEERFAKSMIVSDRKLA